MATKRAKVNKTLEKAKKLVSKKGKNKTKKGTWPEGQARPQSKAYDIENDKTVPAKRTGYRFTKEGAKKLGKQPNDKPTADEIEKYRNQTFKVKGKVNKSGPKGVGDGSFRYLYIESRADKSDLNKARKLELGGETPDEVLRLYVYVDVYENDYKLGEGDVVQSYMVDSLPNPTVKAKYLVRYLENHLYLSDNPNDYSINDDGVIYTDQLQDSDGSPASKGQIEKWKEGKEKLYNARYTIIVEAIKERNPSVEELSKATGIGMYAKGGEMTDGAEFFYISGYWKNDKSEFKDYLVTSADDFVDDDGDDYDIFYYGMTEKDIKDAIKDGEKTDLEFVITSYSKANYSKGGEMFIDLKSGDFRNQILFDPKEVREFEKYVFSYYGKNGTFVDMMEEGIPATTGEVLKAVSQYLAYLSSPKKSTDVTWGNGDSWDREVVRDIIKYNRNPKAIVEYPFLIKDMKKTPILEYGGILQPMIGGVNADPRFDIYNTTMFAEKGAKLSESELVAKEVVITNDDDENGNYQQIGEIVSIIKPTEQQIKRGYKQINYVVRFPQLNGDEFTYLRSEFDLVDDYAKGGKTKSKKFEYQVMFYDGEENLIDSEYYVDDPSDKEVTELAIKIRAKTGQLYRDKYDSGEYMELVADYDFTDMYAKGGMTSIYEIGVRKKGKPGMFVVSIRAKDEEAALKEFHRQNSLLPGAENFKVVGVYKTARRRLEDGGEMAKGGRTHEQGYDDREDERLAMRHGKIASKHFVGSHKRREHSRRDDARFETRNK